MFVQVALKGKGLVAPLAVEVLESRVSLHVSSQVGTVSKGFATVSAAIRLVPCVTSHVALQQPRSRESLSTYITLVVEVVGEHMHAEGRHADVHLVADVALLGVPRVKGAVCLPVAGQVAGSSVVLSTLGARELWPRLVGCR